MIDIKLFFKIIISLNSKLRKKLKQTTIYISKDLTRQFSTWTSDICVIISIVQIQHSFYLCYKINFCNILSVKYLPLKLILLCLFWSGNIGTGLLRKRDIFSFFFWRSNITILKEIYFKILFLSLIVFSWLIQP